MTAWATSPLVVGHRGGRGPGWPAENTLPAFAEARRQGASAIELDVRLSGDGVPVVFHDRSLSRMTGGRDARHVDRVSFAELRSVALLGDARVPALSEVLSWARREHVAVNIELKHDVPSRPALAQTTARDIALYAADVLVSSFDPILLGMMAIAAPRIGRALLTHAAQPRWAYVLQSVACKPLVQALHLESVQATPPVVKACLHRGLRVGVWTLNDPNVARRLVSEGVASIITDAPGVMCTELDGLHRSMTADVR